MESDRQETTGVRPAREDEHGVVLRATRHGALVLQTANARRIMNRLRPAVGDSGREAGAATAGP